MQRRRAITVATLGTAQTLAWASTYYLPAILATPMARDLGTSAPTVFAAFSVALIVSAAVGPRSGAAIDRLGGRPVLIGSSLVFALGLAMLGLARGPVGLFAAWVLLGLGMGCGLYESAFASLVRLYGKAARTPITGITLIAGFASTVGWPLSAWLESHVGWRDTCLAWSALHLLLGLPLNALLPRAPALSAATPLAAPPTADPAGAPASAATATGAPPPPVATASGAAASARGVAPAEAGMADGGAAPATRSLAILAFVFAATWFISTAMAAHLPRLMQAAGVSLATAVLVGSLIGPAQVGARLLEFGWLRKVHPLLSARLACALHPLAAALLLVGGPALAPLFGLFHGAGNGILTIAKGTLPLVLFGSSGYGARQGWLMVPARLTQALAPFAFGLVLDRIGAGALWVTAALGFAAFVALLALHAQPAADSRAAAAGAA
jgi:MFS family permease